MAHTLYTVGHGILTKREFLDRLAQYPIQIVADVRSIPTSIKTPHFDREQLQDWIVTAGFEYHYLGEALGGQPQELNLYRDGVVDYQNIRYQMNFVQGLAGLLNLSAQRPTVILSGLSDPYASHRHHLIARSLIDPEWQVIEGEFKIDVRHIGRNGDLLDTVQISDF